MYYDALKTFVALADIKNFTKTAEYLHISQPSVSLHIKNLETEFNTQLFLRSPKSLKITPSGEILYDRAKQMLAIYDQTKSDILTLQNEIKGKLLIGASFTIGEYVLPSLLVTLQQKYPELHLEVMIGNTDEVVEAVQLLKIDIGLIEGQTTNKELIVEPFMEDELLLVASPSHVLAQKEIITIQDLHNHTWLTREEGSGTRNYLLHVLESNSINIKSLISISSNQGLKEFMTQGIDGLTLLSKSVIEHELKRGTLAAIRLEDHIFKRSFSYVYSPIMGSKKNTSMFIKEINNKWHI
ncbi:LysR family transcriptional regulator [Viridibacillus sp. FSL H8-0123]|uniref:LysR family transcriptional regulator n=1 Tax=Viridibacillus sp. FSL H8-0123 TaxID=1928922 RepID=UPI00096E2582|nr:LysR family transcriptional regulator [Viridibacillus sp. FSL H8-0123]OMC81142.1 LysR family transcriptional regulator [Viridibacillus sp. FSL H8-0123]